jgi:hypothetical protein
LEFGFGQGKDALKNALAGLKGLNLNAGLSAGQTADMAAISGAGRSFAGMSGDTLAQIQAMLGQGMNVGQNAQGSMMDIARGVANGGNNGVDQSADKAMQLAKQLGTYSSGISPHTKTGQVYNDVRQDKTGSIYQNAQGIANDPTVQASIDATLKDVNKAFQRDVGGLNAAASGTGNINSTRAGVMEARMADDAMDRAAGISASVRSDALAKGLGVAQGAAGMRQDGMLGANAQYQNDDATRLAAAGLDLSGKTAGLQGMLSSGNLRLNDRTQGANVDLAAAGLIGQGGMNKSALTSEALGRFGDTLGMSGTAYDQTQAGNSDSLAMGDKGQAQRQAEIQAQLTKLGLPMDFVQQYMATVGGNYGSKGFNTELTEGSPGLLQMGAGLATTAGGLGWSPFG